MPSFIYIIKQLSIYIHIVSFSLIYIILFRLFFTCIDQVWFAITLINGLSLRWSEVEQCSMTAISTLGCKKLKKSYISRIYMRRETNYPVPGWIIVNSLPITRWYHFIPNLEKSHYQISQWSIIVQYLYTYIFHLLKKYIVQYHTSSHSLCSDFLKIIHCN